MRLESLANELLLDLFKFLSGVHLLRAFGDLNPRFDNLLVAHFESNPLDFRSVPKTDFDVICEQHLPSFVDRISSLSLSDDDETPLQTDCFLAYHLTLAQFTHLQSLSLSHIDSEQTMNQMMEELCHLSHLQHLIIRWCHLHSSYVDNIWRHPRLIRCHVEIDSHYEWSEGPTVKSFSIQHLSLLRWEFTGFFFEHLCEYTPCLRHLTVNTADDFCSEQPSSLLSSMETLNLSSLNSADLLKTPIQRMPNLCQLTVRTYNYVDGHQWEKMITNHLPKLKVFRLLMEFDFPNETDTEEQIDQILASFRTPFWINNHQWFVQLHWNQYQNATLCCLYTLPYAFHRFNLTIHTRFRSTCVADADYYSYDRVREISRRHDNLTIDFLRLRFSKIHELDLQLPVEDRFLCVVPTLYRLTSLTISYSEDASLLYQLQPLLDRAPHLYSLTLPNSIEYLIKLTSKSIRQLDLHDSREPFNQETLATLCNSSLGMQCEVLRIKVENRTNIVYLVNHMKNLRSLTAVVCEDAKWLHATLSDASLPPDASLLEWLQQHLPSSCLIVREEDYSTSVHVWIRT